LIDSEKSIASSLKVIYMLSCRTVEVVDGVSNVQAERNTRTQTPSVNQKQTHPHKPHQTDETPVIDETPVDPSSSCCCRCCCCSNLVIQRNADWILEILDTELAGETGDLGCAAAAAAELVDGSSWRSELGAYLAATGVATASSSIGSIVRLGNEGTLSMRGPMGSVEGTGLASSS